MKTDANIKDLQRLVPGTYPSEIVNAKEMEVKSSPENSQIMVEWKTLGGPEYLNGDPSEGHEVTEFIAKQWYIKS